MSARRYIRAKNQKNEPPATSPAAHQFNTLHQSKEFKAHRQFEAEEHRRKEEDEEQNPERCHFLPFFRTYKNHFHHPDRQ